MTEGIFTEEEYNLLMSFLESATQGRARVIKEANLKENLPMDEDTFIITMKLAQELEVISSLRATITGLYVE